MAVLGGGAVGGGEGGWGSILSGKVNGQGHTYSIKLILENMTRHVNTTS